MKEYNYKQSIKAKHKYEFLLVKYIYLILFLFSTVYNGLTFTQISDPNTVTVLSLVAIWAITPIIPGFFLYLAILFSFRNNEREVSVKGNKVYVNIRNQSSNSKYAINKKDIVIDEKVHHPLFKEACTVIIKSDHYFSNGRDHKTDKPKKFVLMKYGTKEEADSILKNIKYRPF